MKTIIVLLLSISTAFASDLYFDAYRFGEPNFTGKAGIAYKDLNAEFSFEDGTAAIGGRKYLSFTNIEIGVQGMLTNKVNSDSIDHRVIDIEGGYHFVAYPYFKAGSDLFAMVRLDESNKAVVQVGFSLGN